MRELHAFKLGLILSTTATVKEGTTSVYVPRPVFKGSYNTQLTWDSTVIILFPGEETMAWRAFVTYLKMLRPRNILRSLMFWIELLFRTNGGIRSHQGRIARAVRRTCQPNGK